MKLAPNFKNDSNDGLSPRVKTFITQSIDDVNALVRGLKAPAAVIVTENGHTAFPAGSLHPHLQVVGVLDGALFRACLKAPEDGYARLVYLTSFGNGAVDILMETPDALEPLPLVVQPLAADLPE